MTPEGRTISVEEIDTVILGPCGDISAVITDSDRVDRIPSGIFPEGDAIVIVEEVDLAVRRTCGEVPSICRNGDLGCVNSVAPPERGVAVLVKEIDTGILTLGDSGDVFKLRRVINLEQSKIFS